MPPLIPISGKRILGANRWGGWTVSSYGSLLRSSRQAARLTIEELSHASGVSVQASGNMERGVSQGPQRRTVPALARSRRRRASSPSSGPTVAPVEQIQEGRGRR